MRCIVSIISDQPIPNLLFIRQYSIDGDFHFFISTEKMEEKKSADYLIQTIGLSSTQFKKIIVSVNDVEGIKNKLQELKLDGNNEYIVNITGGTKLVSLIVGQYVSTHFAHNSALFYLHIGNPSVISVQNKIDVHPVNPNYQFDLSEYIHAHGFDFTTSTSMNSSFSRSADLMNRLIQTKHGIVQVKELANAHTDVDLTIEERMYLTGRWLEEWVYYFLIRRIGIPENQIGIGIELRHRSTKKIGTGNQEIDVAFLYRNKLYLIECKAIRQAKISEYSQYLYKISSFSRNLGLSAHPILLMPVKIQKTGSDHSRRLNIDEMLKLLQVSACFTLEDLNPLHQFEQKFKEIINK
jgi:hypothetical protein